MTTDIALRLEAHNSNVAGVVGGTVALIEIPLRNVMDAALQRRYGSRHRDWWQDPKVFAANPSRPTENETKHADQVTKAQSDAESYYADRRPVVRGDVIANLSFGYWTYRLADERLWAACLHEAFPGITAKAGPWAHDAWDLEKNPRMQHPRKRLHRSVVAIGKLRNRAAHRAIVMDTRRSEVRRHLATVAFAISPDATLLADVVEQSWDLPTGGRHGLGLIRGGNHFTVRDLWTSEADRARVRGDDQ